MILRKLMTRIMWIAALGPTCWAFADQENQEPRWHGIATIEPSHNFEQCVAVIQDAGAQITQVFLSFGVVVLNIPESKQNDLSHLPCIEALEEEKVMEGGGVAGVTN